MSQQHLKIPNTLVAWPWLRAINPHYCDVKAESSAWLESFKPFSPKAQVSFNNCDFNLLAALGYPLASKDHLRTGCDLMNLFFVIDEYTDQAEDEAHVAMIASVTMDALRSPNKPRPHGESIVGEIARQFWVRTVPIITEKCHRRFIETFNTYLQSVVVQACDRSKGHIRSIKDYFDMRRDNIGAKPSFALLEIALDLPDIVMDHSSIRTMTISALDMIIIGNDLVSFKVEHARGDDAHNILTIVKHEFGRGLEHAVQWAEDHNKALRATFLSAIEDVPSWGPEIDEQVSQYLYGLANWVRANDCWSFESQRYFGKHGRAVQSHRLVDLACGHLECTMGFNGKAKNLRGKVVRFAADRELLGLINWRNLALAPSALISVTRSLGPPDKLLYVAMLFTLCTFVGSWLVGL